MQSPTQLSTLSRDPDAAPHPRLGRLRAAPCSPTARTSDSNISLGSRSSARTMAMNSTTSMRRSPPSHFATNDCGRLSRPATFSWVRHAPPNLPPCPTVPLAYSASPRFPRSSQGWPGERWRYAGHLHRGEPHPGAAVRHRCARTRRGDQGVSGAGGAGDNPPRAGGARFGLRRAVLSHGFNSG